MCPDYPLSKRSKSILLSLGFVAKDQSFEFENRKLIVTVNDGGDMYVKNKGMYAREGSACILGISLTNDDHYIKSADEAKRVFKIVKTQLAAQRKRRSQWVEMLTETIDSLS